jgi:dinuclear metal center YbgI/SA1388 family protein
MLLEEFLEKMETIAPQALADWEDVDRIGLIVEGDPEVKNICCALDVTFKVILEAIEQKSTMIVAHHSPLWEPIRTVRGPVASLLRTLLGSGIGLYVMHTNFDRAQTGVNQTLASLLGMEEVEEMPIGVLGRCSCSLPEIATRLNSPLSLYGRLDRLKRLAVVGGSGFQPELMEYALQKRADAFLSSEIKHHLAINPPLPLLVSTHYALEAPAMRRLASEQGWVFIDTAPECTEIR